MKNLVLALMAIVLTSCTPFVVDEKNKLSQSHLQEWNSKKTESSKVTYNPAFPSPVSESHPFYKSIKVGTITGVPEVIRNINIAVASAKNYADALKETLLASNLLSGDPTQDKYKLNVQYIDSPFPTSSDGGYFGSDSVSSTIIEYELVATGQNKPLFNRTIKTTVSMIGSGYQRPQRAKQFSHMTNIASIVWCIEHSNGNNFPEPCVLSLQAEDDE